MTSPLVEMIQDFRHILGVCPCCGKIFRLTDLVISYRAEPAITWLDKLEAAEDRQQRAEERSAESEGRIRELAKARGQRAATPAARGRAPLRGPGARIHPSRDRPSWKPTRAATSTRMASRISGRC
jgi:hypothetical protein